MALPDGEQKLVIEWMNANHPNCLRMQRQRLGKVEGAEEARMFETLLQWVDGLVICEDKVVLIEAKMKPVFDAIDQLLRYKDAFLITPRFTQFKERPIELVFLSTFTKKDISDEAQEKGISVVVSQPQWAKDLVLERYGIRL